MPQITRNNAATKGILKRERVFLPEFDPEDLPPDTPDDDVNARQWTWVKEITAGDKSMIALYTAQNEVKPEIVIAALCAVNDKWELVFGKTKRDAIKMCAEMPESFVSAMLRISFKALMLTGKMDESGEKTEREMVDTEKKKLKQTPVISSSMN